MKNPHFHHPYLPSPEFFTRIEVNLPHPAYAKLKSVFTARGDLITIAAMFLAHVEREIIRNGHTFLDRDTLLTHICSRCSESGPGESELCQADKLAGSDGGRVAPDSPALPQSIHLNNDSEGELTTKKRTKRTKGGKQSNCGEQSSSVA